MAKLYFRHAVMNSGKSLALLQVNHNYVSEGRDTVLFSHKIDNRFGEDVIASRIAGASIQAPSISINDDVNLFDIVAAKVEAGKDVACVLCDESQFYTAAQIDQLSDVVDVLNIPVICYGLKNSFKGELFPASKRLMELADIIESLDQVCWCGCKARMTLKFNSETGEVIRDGGDVEVGAESKYRSVCRKHWKLGFMFKPSVV
jgi:thymidine kinase